MITRVKLALGRSTLLVLVALCGYQYRLLEQRLSRPATTDSSQPMLTLAPHNPAELAPPAMSFSDFLRPDNRIQTPAESPYEHGLTVAHRAEELPYVMRFPLAMSAKAMSSSPCRVSRADQRDRRSVGAAGMATAAV